VASEKGRTKTEEREGREKESGEQWAPEVQRPVTRAEEGLG